MLVGIDALVNGTNEVLNCYFERERERRDREERERESNHYSDVFDLLT